MPDGKHPQAIPEDLQRCVEFHGHICPGLIYGYRVAKEALRLMGIGRKADEEVVAVCENDSCAVDALQVLLGTVTGKGNLIIRNYGKNAYTIISRSQRKAYRFSRRRHYVYKGAGQDEFQRLESSVSAGTASEEDSKTLRHLKIGDLLRRPFDEIFTTTEVPFEEPDYAPLEPSAPCARCGEMTMKTRMVKRDDAAMVCLPCSKNNSRPSS